MIHLTDNMRALYDEVPEVCAICGTVGALWPCEVVSRMISRRHRTSIRAMSSRGDCWLCSGCRAEAFAETSREW